MKFFIFILFLNIFKGSFGQIYKTLFMRKILSILAISDSSINFYIYTDLHKNAASYYNFQLEEQKISSTYEGNMISICYISESNYIEIYIIIKNYLYVFSNTFINYIKFDYLKDRYSNLVLDECVGDEETSKFCSIFVSFINSENQLKIYKYKFKYETIDYSFIKSKEIDLINSSGQISLNNCEYISCHKAKNENDFILVCFYENDNSEIGAISLNKDTLELEKEVKFKKNSGAKNIKSVLFDNNEKVFVCYINNDDNVACITFDVPKNIFLNEFKYIEKITHPLKHFNIDYFDSTDQYILSAYSSETEFEYIIFDKNMITLDDDSINKIEITPCNDGSSFLSITIYYYSYYRIAQKCGNNDISSQSASQVSSTKSYSFEEIFTTDNLIDLQPSTSITYTTIPTKTTILTTFITTVPIKTTTLTTFITTVPIKTTTLTTFITTIPIKTTTLTTFITTIPIKTTTLTTFITNVPIKTTTLTTFITTIPIKTTILTAPVTNIPIKTTILTISNTSISIKTKIFNTSITSIPKIIPTTIPSTSIKTKSSTMVSQKSTLLNQAIKSTIISILETKITNKATSTLTKTYLSSTLIISHETEEIKCSNDIILHNKCIDKVITKEQAEDIQSILRNDIKHGEFNNTNNTIIQTKNIIYQISKIKEQKNNDFSYISSIELDECEEIIRTQRHIKEDDDLIILKTDILDEKDPSKIIVYFEIYDPYNLEMIPLDICDDTTVNIIIPVALDDETELLYKSLNNSGYNLFDLNDSFYNDVCTTYTTADGTDLVLVDRMNIYHDNAQNIYLCQEGCEFVQYNETTKKSKCNCNVKNKLSTMDIKDIKFDKALIVDDFLLKSLTNSNFRVLQCYKLIFSLKGQMNNIGSYLLGAIIFLLFILMICYCITGKRRLIEFVQLILRQKTNEKKIDKKNNQIKKNFKYKKNNDTKNKKILKKPNSSKTIKNSKSKKVLNYNKDNKNNKSKSKDKNNNNNIYFDKFKKNKKSNPPKKSPKHLDSDITTSKAEMNRSFVKRSLFNNKKSNTEGTGIKLNNKNTNKKGNKNNKNIIKLNYINKINIYNKFETRSIKNKIQKIIVLNDIEVNYLNYQKALILDKRTYFQYYCSLLKTKHLFLFTFFLSNDYNLAFIKISLFLLSFSLYFTINGFFFTDETMHKINEDKGAFNIIFQIPQILYSTAISAVINLILKRLSLSETQILTIKEEKNIKRAKILGNKIISCLQIKFIIFFIISFLFSFFFWYFISCFCAVYKNTQNILIKNTLISFGLSMIYPFGLNLLPGIFRIPALRAPKKDKKCLFKISNLIAMI